MQRFFLLFCVLVLLPALLSGCQHVVEKPPMLVPEVVVETVEIRNVQPYITAVGKAGAFEFVNISARVSGFLREVRYEPGDIVLAGAPLFLIEPDQYLAEVKSAQARLASATSQLDLSAANLERTKQLITNGAMTEQDLQTDQAKKDSSAAAVLGAEADLAKAQLNLNYTDVRSPITGKVDRNLVDVGNLVSPTSESGATGAGPGVLTTVAGMDPIYIYFDISDYQFNHMCQYAMKHESHGMDTLAKRLREAKERHKEVNDAYKKSVDLLSKQAGIEPDSTTISPPATQESHSLTAGLHSVKVEFEVSLIKGAGQDSGEYPHRGIIDMVSNRIDESTGTIMVRGEIPNSDYSIFPGQICRVRVPIWEIPDAVLIKQEAICVDLNQHYVFVVDDKNIAKRRVVQLGAAQPGGMRLVEKGLEKGERYVVSGVQNTRDGITVKSISP